MIHSRVAGVKMLIFLELHDPVYPFQHNCAKWFLCGWQHHDSIHFYQFLLHRSTQFHFIFLVLLSCSLKFSTLFLQDMQLIFSRLLSYESSLHLSSPVIISTSIISSSFILSAISKLLIVPVGTTMIYNT